MNCAPLRKPSRYAQHYHNEIHYYYQRTKYLLYGRLFSIVTHNVHFVYITSITKADKLGDPTIMVTTRELLMRTDDGNRRPKPTSFRIAEARAPLCEKIPTGPNPGLESLSINAYNKMYPSSPTKSVSMQEGSKIPMQLGPIIRQLYCLPRLINFS